MAMAMAVAVARVARVGAGRGLSTAARAWRGPRMVASEARAAAWRGPLVLGVPAAGFDEAGAVVAGGALAEWDARLGGAVQAACVQEGFSGQPGKAVTVQAALEGGARTIVLAGLGDVTPPLAAIAGTGTATSAASAASAAWVEMGDAVAEKVRALRPSEPVGVAFVGHEPAASQVGVLAAQLAAKLAPDERFKSAKSSSKGLTAPEEVTLEFMTGLPAAAAEDALRRAFGLARGIRCTCELVNAPAAHATPTHLAACAEALAAEFPESVTTTVLEREACEARGMGLFLGVARASSEPPKFIHVRYQPRGEVRRRVALVGKGVTFDSGGLNLKTGPGSMIELMKFDMGGAAAVLGAAAAVAELGLEHVEVHVVVAACENMVGGDALRPGDVLTASNGTTVEIDNTDAEGRLTLADAMLYAQEHADEVVDVATLTGACIVALGENVAGALSNDEAYLSSFREAAAAAGEHVWPLPLHRPYRKLLDSSCADMKNAGPRVAGTITAGLFLHDFVNKGTPWLHLDIAGPVFNVEKGHATGFGTSTLVEFLSRRDVSVSSTD